ncbi:MAG: FAD:protein FMN transferase [Chitinophagales bacterium]|nr:FAD:protein FMN transferase [Chitinophagales bacterium]
MPQSNGRLSLLILMFSWIAWTFSMQSCKKSSEHAYIHLQGKALGNAYEIVIKSQDSLFLKKSVDSIFHAIELSMSLLNDSSTLSKYNRADTSLCFSKLDDPYFALIFDKAKSIFKHSNGAFNPAVQPLIQYYGFGSEEIKPIKKEDTSVIYNLLDLVVFDTVTISEIGTDSLCIHKPMSRIQLTFNAISPGFAVDMLASFFEKNNLRNYKINLGSEYRALGNNEDNTSWIIGIERPESGQKDKREVLPLELSNKAMVTNGNYQRMYEINGHKYSHIISPFTGISHPTDILSVTVIADDCTTADAYATAFMVLGLEKSLLLLEQLKGIDACFIYDHEADGEYEFSMSQGFSKYYLNNEQK